MLKTEAFVWLTVHWIKKWMLLTVRANKVDEKTWVICLVSTLPPWVMILQLSKKCSFCKFAPTSAWNLSPLEQSTYIYLKVLITLFQKMTWLIGVWATVYEILALKLSKKMLTHQKFIKILWLQNLISPKQ